MNKLEIKNEKLSERCEICHQSDCFDATTNICKRCIFVSKQVNISQVTDSTLNNQLTQLTIHQHWRYCKNHPITYLLSLLFIILLPPVYIGIVKACLHIIHFNKDTASIIYFIIIISLLVVSIISYINKTEIIIERKQLTIKYKPIPLRFIKRINTSEIIAFTSDKSWIPFSYNIKAILNNNKQIIIVDFVNIEKALLIEKHLKSFFNIN